MPNAPKNHPDPTRIAIVGGGFSGVATALRLLSGAAPMPRHVLIIESAPQVGRGIAYRTLNDAHLLNVPAGRMNPVPAEPGRFQEWLRTRMSDATGGSFVPRRWFAAYLDDLLEAAAGGTLAGVRLEVRRGRVVALESRGESVVLGLEDATVVRANRVVLATGHLSPARPRGTTAAAAADRRFVADPWEPGWAARVPRDAAVLFVGSGLTMFDAVLELRAAGHQGPLRAISRHGFLPETHRGLPHDPVGRAHPPALDAIEPTTRGYLRVIRSAIREVEDRGGDWRDVLTSLRPVTPRLWRSLSTTERARFLRHARAHWDAHRHRSPPDVGRCMAQLIAKRVLRITAARVTSIDAGPAGLVVRLARRGGGEEVTIAGAVVNCTGPDTDLSRAADPLIRSLLESGQIRQDPLRLGIDTGEHGELIGRDGTPSESVYYVGPMLRAGWWEATAVPELAAHAVRTADAILRSL